ncbi:ankyrin repeat domain-containing protein [Paenibacillus sp. FSL P4-0338]|uniref:ankyrin repeat domain-containing protein n=1 Tax=unclassified Paenibacillus TaxID=185978 RepID=UPI0003E23B99|nr:ankyrin repeat domain-containing protein [Paenibacillus sp. FSL R7-269]ETT42413.1 ankyrin repeat-containing protein [Paenibacillus sp. FSL R7-269]
MGKKRITLPADFRELVKSGDIDQLKAVFEKCDWNATLGSYKEPALSIRQIPDELVRWLVEQGADINARDKYQRTPLHSQAGNWSGNIPLFLELGAELEALDYQDETPLHAAANYYRTGAIRDLIAHGANIHAVSKRGNTPLAKALINCRNADITAMAEIAQVMLEAGATLTPEMKESVQSIGKAFEFSKANFNKDYLDETVTALDKLYKLFGVEPVAARVMHDGVSKIEVKSTRWQDQHQELWEALIPGSGPALTVQGEVIRITGRISYEIMNNGGGNWGADFRKMLSALLLHFASGIPLDPAQLKEAAELAGYLRQGNGNDEPARLCELAVNWVLANPQPVSLPQPDYKR